MSRVKEALQSILMVVLVIVCIFSFVYQIKHSQKVVDEFIKMGEDSEQYIISSMEEMREKATQDRQNILDALSRCEHE